MTSSSLSVTVYLEEGAVERGPKSEGDSVLDLLIAWVRAHIESDRGATMVEYGLLIVLIALVASVGAFALGGGLDALFDRITACLGTPAAGCP